MPKPLADITEEAINNPDVLSPESINNRFVQATQMFTDLFVKQMTKEDPLIRRLLIEKTMKEHNCSEKKAKQILEKERKAWSKHYDSPLGKAERRIKELEDHLQLIKDVIADPNYLDRFP